VLEDDALHPLERPGKRQSPRDRERERPERHERRDADHHLPEPTRHAPGSVLRGARTGPPGARAGNDGGDRARGHAPGSQAADITCVFMGRSATYAGPAGPRDCTADRVRWNTPSGAAAAPCPGIPRHSGWHGARSPLGMTRTVLFSLLALAAHYVVFGMRPARADARHDIVDIRHGRCRCGTSSSGGGRTGSR